MTKSCYHSIYFTPPVLAVALLAFFVSETLGQTVERQGGYRAGSEPNFVSLANVVTDPGFEAGTPNPFWDEFSTNFGTPLCEVATCGTGTGTGPSSGDWWVWLGGVGGVNESGSVSQVVTINPGAATLIFWTEFILCDSPLDFVGIQIDLTTVWSADGGHSRCGQLGYQLRLVDVGAFADGSPHVLKLTSQTFSQNDGVSNFFIDDLFLDVSLPVELTSFTAKMIEDAAILTWTTASETDNQGFHLEHAVDGTDFKELTFVEGRGTTAEPQAYDYTVTALEPGRHAFRLKQVDFDGTFEYSRTIETVVAVPDQIWLEPVYPNPFNPTAVVSFAVPVEQHVRVQVHDVRGRIVQTLYDAVAAPNTLHRVRFNGTDLESGVYLVRIEGPSGSATQKVTFLK